LPTSDEFRQELDRAFQDTRLQGRTYLDVNAGDLHRRLGGYPGPNNRMPACVNVMRQAMQDGDVILSEPPKGAGASLTLRYQIPRP
jgi:hypothetical protein